MSGKCPEQDGLLARYEMFSVFQATRAGEEPGANVCVYPFVRSYDWYLPPDTESST